MAKRLPPSDHILGLHAKQSKTVSHQVSATRSSCLLVAMADNNTQDSSPRSRNKIRPTTVTREGRGHFVQCDRKGKE